MSKAKRQTFKCDLCNAVLQDEHNKMMHFEGKQHRAAVEREQKRTQGADFGVYVSRDDIPSVSDTELLQLFTQFGEVLQIKRPGPGRVYCIVKYSERDSVERVLNQHLELRGRKLRVSEEKTYPKQTRQRHDSYRQYNTVIPKKQQAANRKASLITSNDLAKWSGSFEHLVEKFVKQIEADPQIEDQYALVCRDLEDTFKHVLPGSKARLFGSSVTGLAFKESDLDIFMECPGGQPDDDFVRRNAMLFSSDPYSQLNIVPKGRAPMYSFTHKRTGLMCDVTVNDPSGLRHSNLVRFFLSLDKRLRELFMLIKCWGFYHKITVSGHMPNFAMTMLIIFYLQQLDPPILPSVKSLQDSFKGDKIYANGWDCSFNEDAKYLKKNTNEMDLRSLLHGFFEYYAKFDCENDVVCPYLGKTVKKSLFVDAEVDLDVTELNEFKLYKAYLKKHPNTQGLSYDLYSLCIQDPFDHVYNITRLTHEKHVVGFLWLCGYTDYMYKMNPDKFLHELFSLPIIDMPRDLRLNNTCRKDIQQIPIGTLKSDTDVAATNERLWFNHAMEAILLVFDGVYKLRISFNEDSLLSTGNHNVSQIHYPLMSFDCEGLYPVYNERVKTRKCLRLNGVTLKNEFAISNYIVENNRDCFGFKAHFNMSFSENRITTLFVDKSEMKFNSFLDFTKFYNGSINELCVAAFEHIRSNGFSKLLDLKGKFESWKALQVSETNVGATNPPEEEFTFIKKKERRRKN